MRRSSSRRSSSGRRLVSSVGILFLAGAAGLLLIGFDGITEHLIPLYAVGAFLAFTLSQAGMVCHWRRQLKKAKHGAAQSWVKLAVNGLGAAATGGALAVILAAKFREGAWVTVLAFPVILGLFKLVKRYYKQVDRQMRTRKPLDLTRNEPPVVVVPIQRWNKLVDKALRFALEMSPDVIAVHLFGHSVQWVAPSLAASVEALQTTDDRTRFMEVLHEYELAAAGWFVRDRLPADTGHYARQIIGLLHR